MGKKSIVIDRPAHAVFARLTDFKRAKEWAPQLGTFKMEAPLREGLEIREERRMLGRKMHAAWTVTRFEPDRAMGLRLRFGPIRGDFEYVLEPAGAATKLTQSTDVRLAGPLAIFTPLLAAEAQKEEDAELPRLKEIIERE